MLAQVTSCAVVGLEGALVQVEVDVSNGGPYFSIVGLPDAAVQEARERVRSAARAQVPVNSVGNLVRCCLASRWRDRGRAARNSGAYFPCNQRRAVGIATQARPQSFPRSGQFGLACRC